MVGYQNNSPSNGRQEKCPILYAFFSVIVHSFPADLLRKTETEKKSPQWYKRVNQ